MLKQKFRQQTQHQHYNHAKAVQNIESKIDSLSTATAASASVTGIDSYRNDTGIDNGDDADNNTGNMINRSGFSDSILTTATAGTSNSKQLTTPLKMDKQQRRQVELFDVAGKVFFFYSFLMELTVICFCLLRLVILHGEPKIN